MAHTTNGVIDTSTGDLLRAGFCDWSADGIFDSGTETYVTNVPCPPYVKGKTDLVNYHQWSGSAWVEVGQP